MLLKRMKGHLLQHLKKEKSSSNDKNEEIKACPHCGKLVKRLVTISTAGVMQLNTKKQRAKNVVKF